MNVPRESKAEQRDRVVGVAGRLMAERGFDDVTMADLADAAGVARATVFNYFGSKHAVVEAITETVIRFYLGMLDEALADETTPTPALLRALYEGMGKGIENDRRFYRGVFRDMARIQFGLDEGGVAQRANEQTKQRLVALVRRGQARGDLIDAFAPEVIAGAFHSLSNGTITDWLYSDSSDSLTARMQLAADVLLSPIEIGGAS